MHKNNEICFQHMLDGAREARLFAQGESRKDLEHESNARFGLGER